MTDNIVNLTGAASAPGDFEMRRWSVILGAAAADNIPVEAIIYLMDTIHSPDKLLAAIDAYSLVNMAIQQAGQGE